MNIFINEWEALGKYGLNIAVGVLLGLLFHFVLYRIGRRIAGKTETVIDNSILSHFRRPLLLFLPVVFLLFASTPFEAGVAQPFLNFVHIMTEILITISVAWMVVKVAYVLEDFLMNQYRMDVRDNLKARKIHTQIQLLKKLLTVLVGLLALGVILMNFEKFRELGTGILASAGLAGIIIGFAAQKTLANLLAGIQIAITQPVRLDDVVIVEGEWGWIEEITLTYVVVRIWDLRRMILPISYFIDKPFQNWTRESADILGTVFLYVDYTIPIDASKTITMWMPMVNVSEEMGALQFASGSHRGGYLDDLPISDESHEVFEEYIRDNGYSIASSGDLNAGDASFHSGWTLHAAPGNHSDTLREAFTIIYYAGGLTIHEPRNENQQLDLETWFPGQKPGEKAASELNPLI